MNPEHVEIVKQGEESISNWWQAHPGERLDLSEADLSEADLSGADLSRADLSGVDLSEAYLFGAYLAGAHLAGAHLIGANLSVADLAGANLDESDLAGADLRFCLLIRASLVGAELTGAKLYGTARDDWNIEGVKCRYMFWDADGEERSPRDRDLAPGEFERLYAQLPTIEYVFENGVTPIDTMVMEVARRAVNDKSPDLDLRFDSLTFRGHQPAMKFTIKMEEQKEMALEATSQEYSTANAKLQGENEALKDVIYRMIDRPPASITAGVAALYGSTINIQEYINHLNEIHKRLLKMLRQSPSLRPRKGRCKPPSGEQSAMSSEAESQKQPMLLLRWE